METARTGIPITNADLNLHIDRAEKYLNIQDRDIEDILKVSSPEEKHRLQPIELELVYSLRRSVCFYLWFANWLFAKSGQKEEAENSLLPTDSIKGKQKFSSTYALWVMSNYMLAECERLLRGKDISKLATLTPNFHFDPGKNFSVDLRAILNFYVQTIESENNEGINYVKCADDCVSVTEDFFQTLSDKAQTELQASSTDLQNIVIANTFNYNGFTINGFKIERRPSEVQPTTWAPVEVTDIVANDEAVIQLCRLVDRLALFDPKKSLNPICEFGGLYESVLLDGPPGTGKTSVIKLAMTRLAKRSEQTGVPYLFKSLVASDVKSEWYGRSSRQLADILTAITDPNNLALFIIDDIDLLLTQRDQPGSGGADRDLLKGLMDFFSGVGTSYKGNYTSIAATNKPTGTDDALRQRFVYRTVVEGPLSWEDFSDLVALQLKRPAKFGMVDIAVGKYVPLKRTKVWKSTPDLKSKHKGSSWEDIGQYITEIRKDDPFFTARSVKNAIDVVVAKSADFDVPEDWYTKSDVFRSKPWDEKLSMIKTLYGRITADAIMASLEDQYSSEKRYQELTYLKQGTR